MKVCPFPRASADDMHQPLLQKCLDTDLLRVRPNNCVNESLRVVLDKILNLKIFIQNSLIQCEVIIFNVINRTDDGKVSLTVEILNNHFNSLKPDIVDNSTIGKECLGKKGLHFTKRGTGKLAINFINKIRSF